MKLTIVTGDIMKCVQVQMCHRSEVYRRIPKEAEWQRIPDKLIKKSVLVRVSETEYVDITDCKTSLGIVLKMALGKVFSIYPKVNGDYYIDVDSIKPYYKNPTVNLNISKIKKDIRTTKKQLERIQTERLSEIDDEYKIKLVR